MFRDVTPFRGRAKELSVAMKFLRSKSHVDVAGEPFSGRSSFLTEIGHRLDAVGVENLKVTGVQSFASQPLGALVATGMFPLNGQAGTVTRAVDLFSKQLNDDLSVIMVDDWEYLDELSQGVIEVVSTQRSLPIIRTLLHTPQRNSELQDLKPQSPKAELLVELQAVPYSELDLILRDALGGSVDSATSARIFSKSGGNVGIALKIVESAVAHDSLVLGKSGWHAQGDLWNPALRSIVEGLLMHLSSPARRALEVLSVSETQELETAISLVGWDLLEELEDYAFLKLYAAHQRSLITISPPIVVEYFRRVPLSLRSLRQQAAFVSSTQNPELHLGSGPLARGGTGERDAVFARIVREHELAQASEAASLWERNPSAENCVTYVRALAEIDAPKYEIESVLFAPVHIGQPAGRGELLRLRCQWRAHEHSDLEGALSELEAGRADLGDHGRLVDAYSASLQTFFGSVPETPETLLAVTADLPPAVADVLRRTLAIILAIGGSPARASAVYEEYLSTTPNENAHDPSDPLLSIILFAQGRALEAYDRSREGLDLAQSKFDIDGCRSHTAVLSWILSAEGSYEESLELLTTIISVGGSPRFLMELSSQLALEVAAGHAAARLGRPDISQTHIQNAESLGVLGPLPMQAPLWANALSLAQLGDRERGADLLWDLSISLWDRGARFAATWGMLQAVELSPSESRLGRVTAAVETMNSAYLEAFLAFLHFRQSGDGEPESIASRLLASKQTRLAIETFESAANRARGEHDLGAALNWEGRARRLKSEHPHIAHDGVPVTRESLLSKREIQVAGLIAAGQTNLEIAEALTLSIRTVETHVHRILKKTKAKTRSEIVKHI